MCRQPQTTATATSDKLAGDGIAALAALLNLAIGCLASR